MNIRDEINSLTAEVLLYFSNTIGWGNTSLRKAEKAVENTLFSIVAFDGDKAVPGEGTTVGLMSAKGKESFYQKLSFCMRPNEKEGMGRKLITVYSR